MRSGVLGLSLALVLLLPAVIRAQTPGSGITGTAHDFVQNSRPDIGLCTYCHTPHRAIGTRLLWNHTLPATLSYGWKDIERTIGGTLLPTIVTQSWTGPSKFCLTCHDGSVAIGDVNWWMARKPPSLDVTHVLGAFVVGANGDLSGNHPVAIPYPYMNQKNTYNSVVTGDFVILDDFVPDPSTAGHIRLFNNPLPNVVVAGAVPGMTGIECSSCHDPHNGSTVEDKYFLRGKLTGELSSSYICLKCHRK